ncbi:ATP-binding protein [Halovenus rubra]|uniref:ATP-binding protein n=2 Tax=Halovenus rubra TaxID=869890 RepID=A0ACC7E1L8_9EURY|nr:ATP-binding protein [Halovenus rubra]
MVSRESLSVLVVDDSDFFASMLSDKLETEYEITTTMAQNAADALSEAREQSFDCIVSDYEMPVTSGLELYEMIEEEMEVPFVLLTAQGNEEVASQAITVGIDDYLLKESVMEESLDLLVNRIRNLVEQRRTQRKYEQLVANSPDVIAQLRLDGEIIAANDSMATEFSAPQSELVGQQISAFLPDEIAEGRLDMCKQALALGNAVTFQDSIGVRHFHNIAVPLSAGGDEMVQLVTREMTHQKHNERELEQKTQTLAMINRIVSHDIRNDVQLLMMWAGSLGSHVDDSGQEFVDRIQDTSNHIAEFTTIARDFVESIEGEGDLELEPVDIATVLETEIEKKREAFAEGTVVIENIPSVTVKANELLSSVFGNLLSNAIRHNKADNPEAFVTVEETDTHVRIYVEDNGPGIPDENKETIFEKGTMDADSPGSGVGLFLVSTLVDQYNGQIWVEDSDSSEANAGSVFTVELPKAEPEQ